MKAKPQVIYKVKHKILSSLPNRSTILLKFYISRPLLRQSYNIESYKEGLGTFLIEDKDIL